MLHFEGASSSCYLFIADAGGDMQLAVNDMSVCDRLTPQALEDRLEALNAMDAVVLDANLPAETVAFWRKRCARRCWPTRCPRPRPRGCCARCTGCAPLKPNAIEAEALTGIAGARRRLRRRRRGRLVDMGARRAFITLGERGVCARTRGGRDLPGAAVRLVNATGAGDAFTAALAWAPARGCGLRDCAAAGLAAASIAVEADQTVSPPCRRNCWPSRMAASRRNHTGRKTHT